LGTNLRSSRLPDCLSLLPITRLTDCQSTADADVQFQANYRLQDWRGHDL
jgi:hypothetical protein